MGIAQTYIKKNMPQRPKQLRTIKDLTEKQKTFIDILVDNWGQISKSEALQKAGYSTKGSKQSIAVIASRLTNPKLNPHVCRYLEMRLQQ